MSIRISVKLMKKSMSDKKRILIIVAPIQNMGGITRRLSLWTKYLTRSYDIRILCHTPDPSVLKIFEGEGAEVVNSTGLNRKGRVSLLPGISAICKEIERYRPNAVISMFFWTDFLTSLSKYFCNRKHFFSLPHIIHIAGDPAPFGKVSIIEKIYKIINFISFSSCDKAIFICQHDAEMAKKMYHLRSKKVHVTPIGIETGHIITKNMVHKPFAFGVVSRLSPEKNIDIIIKSFKKVHEKHPHPLKLHIFAVGVELNNLLTLSRNIGLEDDVHFNGFVENPYFAFDAIDCLVMFSQTEGTPRSILEAALRGVPAIARNVGGVGEIIQDGNTGFLILTELELIEKMKYCANNETNVLEMGANAAAFVSKKHSIEIETEDIGRVVESLSS